MGIAGNRASPGCIILGSGVKFSYFCNFLKSGSKLQSPSCTAAVAFLITPRFAQWVFKLSHVNLPQFWPRFSQQVFVVLVEVFWRLGPQAVSAVEVARAPRDITGTVVPGIRHPLLCRWGWFMPGPEERNRSHGEETGAEDDHGGGSTQIPKLTPIFGWPGIHWFINYGYYLCLWLMSYEDISMENTYGYNMNHHFAPNMGIESRRIVLKPIHNDRYHNV